MKTIFFTTGPSQLYPTFNKHLDTAVKNYIPSISHRGQQFKDIYKNTSNSLKQLLNIPSDYHIFFISSSLESMERILENCVINYSFHFVNGTFSKKFYEIAKQLGKTPNKIEVSDGEGFNFETIKIPKNTGLICITQNETSTGVSVPINGIYKLKKSREQLIALDVVSSVPYQKIDFRKIDIAFFSVQKGFGLPSGMGVLIVNNKAIDRALKIYNKDLNIGSFHSFKSLLEKEKDYQTPETPNVLNIYLLGKICQDMLKKGIEKIRKETEIKADMLYDFFDKHNAYKPFVKNNKFQSKTIIVIDVNGKSKQIINKLSVKGIVVGSGYGKYKENHIRIANFPVIKVNEVKKLVKIFKSL